MEGKKYCAYNRTQGSFLSLRITAVDLLNQSGNEQLHSLADNSQSGLWLSPCGDIPAGDSRLVFDLVYLDQDCRVINVESFPNLAWERPKEQVASALALPPRTIISTQTQPGDEIIIWTLEETVPLSPRKAKSILRARAKADAEPVAAIQFASSGHPSQSLAGLQTQNPQPPAADALDAEKAPSIPENKPSRMTQFGHWVVARLPRHEGPTPISILAASSSLATSATGKDNPGQGSPVQETLIAVPPPTITQIPNSPAKVAPDHVAPGPVAPAPVTPVQIPLAADKLKSDAVPVATPPTVFTPAPVERVAAVVPPPPAPRPAAPAAVIPAQIPLATVKPPVPAPVPVASPPAMFAPTPVERVSAVTQSPTTVTPAKMPPANTSPAWVAPAATSPIVRRQSTHSFAEKNAPNRTESVQPAAKNDTERRDAPREQVDDGKKAQPEPKAKLSLASRFLRWLTAPPPAAERLRSPGIVAYFWTGGTPQPHRVANISVTGLYLLTKERWLTDTVLVMTLQLTTSEKKKSGTSISVLSKVVRSDEEGVGLQFVTSESVSLAAGQYLPGKGADRQMLEQFLERSRRVGGDQ